MRHQCQHAHIPTLSSQTSTHGVDQLLVDHVLHGRSHRPGVDRVDRRPREAQETVVATVLEEAGAEFLRELDSLARNSDVADCDGLVVDVPGGGRAVAVADVP